MFDKNYIKGYFMQVDHWMKKGWLKNTEEHEEVYGIKKRRKKMNFNNRHFQIKNFHFHFHRWKHNFTYESQAGVFTQHYYTCPKCTEVLSEISGWLLGCFRENTSFTTIEVMETMKKSQEMQKDETSRRERLLAEAKIERKEKEETCTCTVYPPTDSLLLRYIEMVNYKMCPFCKKELLELLQKE